ncbi:MAG: hypothetical protein PHZ04_02250 [Patescibacteria group bacterium]|nr:hypothetical protein [Patescibacteria group bacterium]MDD5294315.1 hypothetical protein [Patescibacteria group bacterium]MDD5554138.1 hypothetical protein [Patescibacteria group bacterium]
MPEKYSNHMDSPEGGPRRESKMELTETGIATKPEDINECLELYQQALNEFFDEMNKIKKIGDESVNIRVVGVSGGIVSGKGRPGIFESTSSYQDALNKATYEKHRGQSSDDYPSDLDVVYEIEPNLDTEDASRLKEIELITQGIYEKFGVVIDATRANKLIISIPIEELLNDGLIKKFISYHPELNQ